MPSKDESTKQDNAALALELLGKKEILNNALKKRLESNDKSENQQRVMQDGNQVSEDDQQSLNEWEQRYQKYSDSELKEYESACQDVKRVLEELEQAIKSYNNEGNVTSSNEPQELTESPIKENHDTEQTSPMGQGSAEEIATDL